MIIGFKISDILNLEEAVTFVSNNLIMRREDIFKALSNPEYIYYRKNFNPQDAIGKPFEVRIVTIDDIVYQNTSGQRLEIPTNVILGQVVYSTLQESQIINVQNVEAKYLLDDFVARRLLQKLDPFDLDVLLLEDGGTILLEDDGSFLLE